MEARKLNLSTKNNAKVYVQESAEVLPLKRIKPKNAQTDLFPVKAIVISILVVFLSILLFFVSRYAGISALQSEVSTIEKMKRQLLSEKADLTAELEGLKASLKIQEEAKYKLGMVYPTEDQIVYLTVEDGMTVRTDTRAENIFEEIKQMVIGEH